MKENSKILLEVEMDNSNGPQLPFIREIGLEVKCMVKVEHLSVFSFYVRHISLIHRS